VKWKWEARLLETACAEETVSQRVCAPEPSNLLGLYCLAYITGYSRETFAALDATELSDMNEHTRSYAARRALCGLCAL
jgi:hypothetical protein